MKRKQCVTYGRYLGDQPTGRDCLPYNPHGFVTGAVAWVISPDCPNSYTGLEWKVGGKTDSHQLYRVCAPADTWVKIHADYRQFVGNS